jgi:uncharacterized protein YdcH (DUF465 family)
VAHTCNPSYSKGRDQEDHGSKPAWANSSWDPLLKKPFTKRAGGVAQAVGPEFKSQYHKKKKRNSEYCQVTDNFNCLNKNISISIQKNQAECEVMLDKLKDF